ncbi:hypothetical protein N9207_01605, partial [bacterium]|nr:hypothetical protein [bacterium]
FAFWIVLAQETIVILDQALLPGMIGSTEIALCPKFAADFKVLGELETIVVSERSCFEWSESTNHRFGDCRSSLVCHPFKETIAALSFDHAENESCPFLSFDKVNLPVAVVGSCLYR